MPEFLILRGQDSWVRVSMVAGASCRFDRHMHLRAIEDAGAKLSEQRCSSLGLRTLRGRAQHKRTAHTERIDLLRQALQTAAGEDHARRLGREDEVMPAGCHAETPSAFGSVTGCAATI